VDIQARAVTPLFSLFEQRGLALHASRRLINAAELQTLDDAADVLLLAQRERERMLAEAQVQAEDQRGAGYRRGLDEAAAAVAERLLAIDAAHAADIRQQEQDLLDLARTVFDRVAPSLPAGDLLAALARQAVEQHRQGKRLVVKVHPERVTRIEAELQDVRRACGWIESLTVVGVPEFDLEGCVLESPYGFVDASWDVQRAAIERALRQSSEAEG
jgi:flagellar assembly protein FliH